MSNQPDTGKSRIPISFWLQKASEAFDARVHAIYELHGVSSGEWRAINVLGEVGEADEPQIAALVGSSCRSDQLPSLLESLAAREFVERAPHPPRRFRLTVKGRFVHRDTRAKLRQLQASLLAGVAESEFETTVSTLARIIHNLSENGGP